MAAQRECRHTRRSAQDELLEAQTGPEKILRRQPANKEKASAPEVYSNNNPSQEVTVNRPAPSPYSWSDRDDIDTYSEDSAYSIVEVDPIEEWYSSVGYLPDLSESIFAILEQFLSPDIMSIIKRKLYKSEGNRLKGLDQRNVSTVPDKSTDPFLAVFHDGMKFLRECGSGSGVHLLDLHDEVKKHHADEWKLDLDKLAKDGLQATFQRTLVMMSMLDRYRLMYKLEDSGQPILDFAIESTWNCPSMLTRELKMDSPDIQNVLSRPRLDISVAFHLSSIINTGLMVLLPDATRNIMTYEAPFIDTRRAFHFLMIEANHTGHDTDSRLKNLNSASQSLHCLYEFFHEADRLEVECNKPCCTPGAVAMTTGNREYFPDDGDDTFVGRFFEEVRVFTAVLTEAGIKIRVHRACRARSSLVYPSSGVLPCLIPGYPLRFEYSELPVHKFSAREQLMATFEKIMVDYGIGRFRPLLQEVAEAIVRKCYKWQMETGFGGYRMGMRHYSHGQTADSVSSPGKLIELWREGVHM
ncbi:hypothetical protein F4802DRAFT_291402 [Xylaria palmicola]|nr:hypothetical protein F4802DRAFT_291402 [Xylaria palmicola]